MEILAGQKNGILETTQAALVRGQREVLGVWHDCRKSDGSDVLFRRWTEQASSTHGLSWAGLK